MCLFTALKFYNKMFSKRDLYKFFLNLLMKYFSRVFLIKIFFEYMFSKGVNSKFSAECPRPLKCCPTGVMVF